MKRLLLILAALLYSIPAYSQAPTKLCFPSNAAGTNCITVDANNPLPVDATVSATITFPTIGAAVPATGIYNGLNVAGTLRGMTGLALGSTFSQTTAIVDASGNQIVNFGSSNAEGPVTASTVATKSILLGCQYLSSAQTFTTAQQGATLCDANGRLSVTVFNANSNGQATATNSSPVVLASNQTAADPCMFQAKTNVPISTSSSGPVSLVALSGSTKVYVCSISGITDTAIKLSFIDGTGGSCASGQHAIWGSTTAANGMSLAANGGFTLGNGQGTIGVTAAASAFCLLQSGTSLIAGNLTYVQQ